MNFQNHLIQKPYGRVAQTYPCVINKFVFTFSFCMLPLPTLLQHDSSDFDPRLDGDESEFDDLSDGDRVRQAPQSTSKKQNLKDSWQNKGWTPSSILLTTVAKSLVNQVRFQQFTDMEACTPHIKDISKDIEAKMVDLGYTFSVFTKDSASSAASSRESCGIADHRLNRKAIAEFLNIAYPNKQPPWAGDVIKAKVYNCK